MKTTRDPSALIVLPARKLGPDEKEAASAESVPSPFTLTRATSPPTPANTPTV